MQRGRPVPELTLTAEEREILQSWAQRRKTAQALALRARVILACAEGRSNTAVGSALQLCKQTVGKWRRRFVVKRLDGLLDEPRPGAPRRISDAQVERVLTATLESLPANATHWSTRLLARRCGMSQSAVSRIWRWQRQEPRTKEQEGRNKQERSKKEARSLAPKATATLKAARRVAGHPVRTQPENA